MATRQKPSAPQFRLSVERSQVISDTWCRASGFWSSDFDWIVGGMVPCRSPKRTFRFLRQVDSHGILKATTSEQVPDTFTEAQENGKTQVAPPVNFRSCCSNPRWNHV